MSDIGLDGTNDALARSPTVCAPEGLKTFKFYGISHRGPCGMALDKVYILWRPADLFIDRTHGTKLSF